MLGLQVTQKPTVGKGSRLQTVGNSEERRPVIPAPGKTVTVTWHAKS